VQRWLKAITHATHARGGECSMTQSNPDNTSRAARHFILLEDRSNGKPKFVLLRENPTLDFVAWDYDIDTLVSRLANRNERTIDVLDRVKTLETADEAGKCYPLQEHDILRFVADYHNLYETRHAALA